jgi:hypothetical protein
MERRVILISERLLGGAGFVVSRMLGLRNPDQFTKLERPADAAPWVGGVYEAAGGTKWMELDLPGAGSPARIPRSRRLRRKRKYRGRAAHGESTSSQVQG